MKVWFIVFVQILPLQVVNYNKNWHVKFFVKNRFSIFWQFYLLKFVKNDQNVHWLVIKNEILLHATFIKNGYTVFFYFLSVKGVTKKISGGPHLIYLEIFVYLASLQGSQISFLKVVWSTIYKGSEKCNAYADKILKKYHLWVMFCNWILFCSKVNLFFKALKLSNIAM